jgi:hypothetical protein
VVLFAKTRPSARRFAAVLAAPGAGHGRITGGLAGRHLGYRHAPESGDLRKRVDKEINGRTL